MSQIGTSDRGAVCLTFDDGPDPVWTPEILDVLAEASAKATFFVITPRAREYPHLIERMTSEDHEVALHCERHFRHSEIGEDDILRDTLRGLADLDSMGIRPMDWRTPWGIVTTATSRTADELGLRLVHWTEDTHDWRGDPSSEMFRRTITHLRSGSVVLMHDGLGPGAAREGCDGTVKLVSHLLGGLDLEGLEPVTVAELYGAEDTGRLRTSTA